MYIHTANTISLCGNMYIHTANTISLFDSMYIHTANTISLYGSMYILDDLCSFSGFVKLFIGCKFTFTFDISLWVWETDA